jgi:hypothetical protein
MRTLNESPSINSKKSKFPEHTCHGIHLLAAMSYYPPAWWLDSSHSPVLSLFGTQPSNWHILSMWASVYTDASRFIDSHWTKPLQYHIVSLNWPEADMRYSRGRIREVKKCKTTICFSSQWITKQCQNRPTRRRYFLRRYPREPRSDRPPLASLVVVCLAAKTTSQNWAWYSMLIWGI